MNLAQLRAFSVSPQYAQYQRYLAATAALQQAEAQRIPEFASWAARYNELNQLMSQSQTCKVLVETAQRKLKSVTDEYRESFKKLEDTNVLSAFYKESLEDVTHQYLDELSKTLTEVYCSVYDSTNKQVQLVLEDYRGKKVVHLKYLNSYEGNIYPESIEDDGGSAQIILGIIISIYFILATESPRVLFIDEAFSAISPKVLKRFLEVLKKFSDELGFVILCIDHASYKFRGYVTQLFTIEDGVYKEIPASEIDSFIDQTRGDDDE